MLISAGPSNSLLIEKFRNRGCTIEETIAKMQGVKITPLEFCLRLKKSYGVLAFYDSDNLEIVVIEAEDERDLAALWQAIHLIRNITRFDVKQMHEFAKLLLKMPKIAERILNAKRYHWE